jgi:hypothetical protein
MSWGRDLTKAQRRELRRIAGLAYDRELAAALGGVEEQFRRWRSGEIGPHDLNEAIHRFHQGPSRQLWLQYNDDLVEFAALEAVQRGVVAASEIAPEVLEILKPRLEKHE